MKSQSPKLLKALKTNRKRGSAIALVMILSIAMLIVIASQLNRGTSSMRFNIASGLYYEAKNAAESYAEYGCADIVKRFETKTSFPKNELKNDPIATPVGATAFYTGSNIDLSKTTVKGGEILDGYWLYIDPEDPRWEFDPMKGKKVFVRDVNIFSKAVAKRERFPGEFTAYVQQTLQVRDSPLFSNAIFYNMDLELHPGPVMNIYGPVHSNQNAWLEAIDQISFHDTVSASGKILHGNPKTPSNIHNQTGRVYFRDSNDHFVDMRLGGSGTADSDWLDHRNPEWREKSSQTWDGNVQDEAHNVPVYNAAGIKDNIPDNPYTAVSELENHAYAVIEPILPWNHPDKKSLSVRNQKMAAKAGLIFKVELDSTTETGFRVRAYKWSRTNMSLPLNPQNPFDDLTVDANGDPIMIEIQIPSRDALPAGVLASDLIGAADSTMTMVDNQTDFTNTQAAQPEQYDAPGGVVQRGLYDHRQEFGISPLTIDIGVLRQVVDDNANPIGLNLADTYWKEQTTGTITYNPSTDWNGVVYVEFPLENSSGGAVDKIVPGRRTMTVPRIRPETTLVPYKISDDDVQDDEKSGFDVGLGNGTHILYKGNYYPQPGGNYLYLKGYWHKQNVSENYTYQLALQIINGEYIPSPTFAPEPGLTIVTNAPVYLVGDYNADGVPHTDDASKIEFAHYTNQSGVAFREPPAAIMCDAFTILSNDWSPGGADNRSHSQEASTGNRGANTFTEVSAAILTGLKPTIPEGSVSEPTGGAQSGGAHNFPRFLEDWNTTLTIRTSMVALFESEVHVAPMPDNHGHYYGPPTRDWGFNQNFDEGIYPPGTPNVRTFRRTAFADITEEEYLAGTTY